VSRSVDEEVWETIDFSSGGWGRVGNAPEGRVVLEGCVFMGGDGEVNWDFKGDGNGEG
jgi:hypothetical protein